LSIREIESLGCRLLDIFFLDMEKENSCINCKAILDYVKDFRDGDLSGLLRNLDPEIDRLSDPENFLRDPNNWVSSALVSRLFKRARMVFEDEMAAYNIARHAVENVTLGYIQRIIVKAFWSIKHGLKNLQKIDAKFSRTKRVELAEIKRNEAIVRLHWHPEDP